MNLPFGLPARKDSTVKKKDEALQTEALLEQKLEELEDVLEAYKNCIREYSDKLDGYDKDSSDDQRAGVQTAMDINYLKGQEDKAVDLLYDLGRTLEEVRSETVSKTLSNMESISESLADTNLKLDGLDKNVVNRLSELLLELQKQTIYQGRQHQTELVTDVDTLTLKVKKGQTLLWVIFFLNIFGLGVLAFLVLYVLEIIPFNF